MGLESFIMSGGKKSATIDYATSGLTIQQAMVDMAKRYPSKKDRPKFIHWGKLCVQTADAIPVPAKGMIRLEFISARRGLEQGCDLAVDGWFTLANGFRVDHLRTWNEARFEPVVSYPYESNDGIIWFWNVYKRQAPNGQMIEEKWTENAGFWIQEAGPHVRIYHCSPGTLDDADFERLVVKLSFERRDS